MIDDMTTTVDVSSLPLVPKNPLPLWQLVKLVRRLDTGQEVHPVRSQERVPAHRCGDVSQRDA
jgi:hypothetical protein